MAVRDDGVDSSVAELDWFVVAVSSDGEDSGDRILICGMPDSSGCTLGATVEITRVEGFWKN